MKRTDEIKNKGIYNINDLIEIMSLLRSEGGCPWDREQTHKSIRKNLIEETYEVIEAIDSDDYTLMKEELGDLLLQVVFHSRMAEEEGYFNFDGVCNDICKKLIIRHPHIFGDVEVNGSEQVLLNWDNIKKQEKKQNSVTETLESVSKSLPSLMRAQKLAKKAMKSDLWHFSENSDTNWIESGEELAERLFELCAKASKLGLDAEELLSFKCESFISEMSQKEGQKKQ